MAVAVPHLPLAAQISEDTNEGLEMAASSLTTDSPASKDEAPMPGDFDIVKHYGDLLQRDEVGPLTIKTCRCTQLNKVLPLQHLAMPVAAIESLAQVVARSDGTPIASMHPSSNILVEDVASKQVRLTLFAFNLAQLAQ